MFVPQLVFFPFLGMAVPQFACLFFCWHVCSQVGMVVPQSACLFLCRHVCCQVGMVVPQSACLFLCRQVCSPVEMVVTKLVVFLLYFFVISFLFCYQCHQLLAAVNRDRILSYSLIAKYHQLYCCK